MRVAAALTLSIVLSLARPPAQHSAPTGKLEVELRDLTKRRSYRLKDSVLLDVEIINSGSDPVGVFAKLGVGYQGGVILHALDSAGAEAQPQILPHDFLDLRATDNPKSYFELQPDQLFGTRQKFAVLELVSKPGH